MAKNRIEIVDEPRKPPPVETKASDEIHIVGLKKVSPDRYVIVTGVIPASTPGIELDTIAQPFIYSAEGLKIAIARMLRVIP